MLVGVLKSNPLVVSPEALALLKALSPYELGGAAYGLIPRRLGGGPVGGAGVERGSARFRGAANTPIPPSRAYHRAMQGGGAMAPPPPQPSERPEISDEFRENVEFSGRRPWEQRPRGGRLPPQRMTAVPTHEGMKGVPRRMSGSQTADIPGAPEVPPWVREHSEFEPSEREPEEEPRPPMSELDRALGQAFPQGQPIEVQQRRALQAHAAAEGRRAGAAEAERKTTPTNPFPRRQVAVRGRELMATDTGGVVGAIDRDRPGVTDQTRRG